MIFKHNRSNSFLKWLVAFTALIAALPGYAAMLDLAQGNITSSSTDIKLFQADTTGDLHLLPETIGTDGLSNNAFNSFVVNSEMKVSSPNFPDGVSNAQPRVIVISAPTIDLNNKLILSGASADIVFVATSNIANAISCNGCSFEGFKRISFVTIPQAQIIDLASDTNSISPQSNATVYINGLDAPHAVAVDVLSNDVSLGAQVNMISRVSQTSSSQYMDDTSGSYTNGMGMFNLVLGKTHWNYKNSALTKIDADTSTYILSGDIRAAAFNLAVSGNLDWRGTVNTSTNVLSSTNFHGDVFIPKEKASITAFGDLIVPSSASFTSTGDVYLQSNADIQFSNRFNNKQAKLSIISAADTNLVSEVDAKNVYTGASNVSNTGQIKAVQNIEVWAENSIENHRGGKLVADQIKLKSNSGAVRNGSRTPFVSETSDALLFIEDMPEWWEEAYGADQYVSSQASMLAKDPLMSGIYAGLNKTQMAADFEASGQTFATDLSAHILANEIVVEAIGFENINPYWQSSLPDGAIVFSETLYEQVSIVAEESITVKAPGYCINSSSEIVVNNFQGTLAFECGSFVNEPYRTEVRLDAVIHDSSNAEYTTVDMGRYEDRTMITGATEETSIELSVYRAFASPPARLKSMGQVNISATSIVSNTSFVEIYGNAVFDANVIHMIGMKLTGVGVVDTVEKDYRIYRHCYGEHRDRCRAFNWLADVDEETVANEAEPLEMDSLFLVQGTLDANAASGWFYNHKPLEDYTEEAVDNFMFALMGDEDARFVYTPTGTSAITNQEPSLFGWNSETYKTITAMTETEQALANGEVEIETRVLDKTCSGIFCETETRSLSEIMYSLVEIFTEFIQNVLSYISEAWDSLWD